MNSTGTRQAEARQARPRQPSPARQPRPLQRLDGERLDSSTQLDSLDVLAVTTARRSGTAAATGLKVTRADMSMSIVNFESISKQLNVQLISSLWFHLPISTAIQL